MWGQLINASRTAARICSATMPASHNEIACKLIVCYCYALMHHLQGRNEEQLFKEYYTSFTIPFELQTSVSSVIATNESNDPVVDDCTTDLSRLPNLYDMSWQTSRGTLSNAEQLLENINCAQNKPLEVLLQLSVVFKLSLEWKEWAARQASAYPPWQSNIAIERDRLEKCSSDLMEILGKCERIVKSPVPASWNRHTSRLISLWTLTLPLVLVPIQGVLSVPTVAVISWVLFSIQEIGYLLEDPFRRERYSLPLEELCETIRIDVLEQIVAGK